MTLEEKLEHFQAICFSDAKERNERMLKEYRQSLEASLEEHKKDARRQADMEVKAAGEKIQHQLNRQLALEQMAIRREQNQKQGQLKDGLMEELKRRLAAFKDAPEYGKLLERQAKAARDFAGSSRVVIYLDASDQKWLEHIAAVCQAETAVGSASFLGGIRAAIPEKNILIDDSFQARIEELERSFQITL